MVVKPKKTKKTVRKATAKRTSTTRTYRVAYFVRDDLKYEKLVKTKDIHADLWEMLSELPTKLFYDASDKKQKILEMYEDGEFDEHGYSAVCGHFGACMLIIKKV